ncbi:MAG: lipoyl(octanoyl) transferase LipB [Desulfobulbus sp.]|nr:lipoyl(octanoyl) transferase LipB [Desulfobulbus sp.]
MAQYTGVVRIIDCGRMNFLQSLALQEELVTRIAADEDLETLLLVEHPAVYTMGRGGLPANIRDSTIHVERISRGGDITWHGPGQLVGYPLINLAHRGRDLHRWMHFLETVLLDILSAFAVCGHRVRGARGVWTRSGKIGFVGVGVRRWITMHGFSLNVCPDLSAFYKINPCGYVDCPITTMTMESGVPISLHEVKRYMARHFAPMLHDCMPPVAFIEGNA